MSCPISHPSDQDVLRLINQQNNAELRTEDVDIDVPALSIEHERNTVTRVASTPDSPYNGFVDVFYDRLDIKRLFHDAEEVEIIVGGSPDFQDVICGLNATYGTTFDSAEFTGTEAVNDVVTITAKAGSRGYVGTLKVRLIHERIHLQDRLTTLDLSGFGYDDGGTVVVEQNKVMPSNFNLGFTSGPSREAYAYGRNDEVFAGGRSVTLVAPNPPTFERPSFLPADATYAVRNTSRLADNSAWRFVPYLSMFFGLLPAQQRYAHILDGYAIDVEMKVSNYAQNNTFTRKGKVQRVDAATYLNIVFDDGQIIRMSAQQQDGIRAYNWSVQLPVAVNAMFPTLQAGQLSVIGSPVNQKVAVLYGFVDFTITLRRLTGRNDPVVVRYRTRINTPT